MAIRASASMAIAVVRASIEDWLATEGGPGTHGLCFCEHGEWTLIGEPHVDMDARVIHAPSAEMIAQYSMLDVVFLGHDELTGTIQLSIFEGGEPTLSWQDSLEPFAENVALTFHDDGRCTQEDATRCARSTSQQRPPGSTGSRSSSSRSTLRESTSSTRSSTSNRSRTCSTPSTSTSDLTTGALLAALALTRPLARVMLATTSRTFTGGEHASSHSTRRHSERHRR